MPAIPFGGLSFFLNVGIVIIGAIVVFLRERGYRLHWLRSAHAVVVEKEFDKTWRRVLGYAIALTTFSFLFFSMGASLALRLEGENNADLLRGAIAKYYSTESQGNPVAVNKIN